MRIFDALQMPFCSFWLVPRPSKSPPALQKWCSRCGKTPLLEKSCFLFKKSTLKKTPKQHLKKCTKNHQKWRCHLIQKWDLGATFRLKNSFLSQYRFWTSFVRLLGAIWDTSDNVSEIDIPKNLPWPISASSHEELSWPHVTVYARASQICIYGICRVQYFC